MSAQKKVETAFSHAYKLLKPDAETLIRVVTKQLPQPPTAVEELVDQE